MKVSFNFTPRDLADVASRLTSRSRVARRWRMDANLRWSVLVGAILFAALPGDIAKRLIYCLCFAGALTYVLQLLSKRPTSDARLTAYYREQLGGDGPFLCEVDLSDSGLHIVQLGVQATHAWNTIASIESCPEGVMFNYRPMGLLLVRERAFSTPQQKETFLALANSYHAQGNSSAA
jgi:hypothetical protein